MSRSLLTSRTMSCCPTACAAATTSIRSASVLELFKFANTPIVVALGTSWRSNSKRFAPNTAAKKTTPVTLPPGRLRLVTRPSLTGSLPVTKTIGIVVVAAFAANAGQCSRRSRQPAGESIQPPEPATDRVDLPPIGIRSRRPGHRRSLLPSGPGGMRSQRAPSGRASCCGQARSPASPAAVPVPHAATRLPRRQAS